MMPSDFDKGFTIQIRPTDNGKYQLRMVWYDDADSVEEVIIPTEYANVADATVAATAITQDVIRGWGTTDIVSDIEELDDDDDDDDEYYTVAFGPLGEDIQQALYDNSMGVLRSLLNNMDLYGPPVDDTPIDPDVVEEFSEWSSDFIKGMLYCLPVCVAALPILNSENIEETVYLAAIANILTRVLMARGDIQ